MRAAVSCGRLLRLPCAVIAVLLCALFAARASGAQDSSAARTPSAEPPQSMAPRTVSGRVVRPGRTGMVTVPGTWVTLHRVAPDSSGPVDSVRTDANGRYAIRYKPVGTNGVYFASSMYGGVAYFTAPLPPSDASGDAGEITVFDTTSGPVAIRTLGRHLVVSSSAVDGHRTLVEVFQLQNDSTVTAVAGARGRATWSAALPPNAAGFEVGQSDIGADAVQFRDGRVLVYASLSPGIRQLAFSYSVPASDFPLAVRLAEAVGVLEVLVEDPGATAAGGGLVEQQPVSLEGRRFRRFLAQDAKAGSTVTVSVGDPTGPRTNRFLLVPVLVAAAVMVFALAFALTRRRPGPVVTPRAVPDDATRLARDIADLDDAFERVSSPSDAERDAYRQRRDALKARLTAALAKEEVAV